MELELVDPYDGGYYNPRYTVVVAFADPEIRAEVVEFYSHYAHVFDIYRDPAKLLPMLVDIACFFRILDTDSYFAVEEQIIADVALGDGTAPYVVYGLGENMLFESPYVINGDKSLPAMVKVFFDHCRSNRR